MNKEMYCKQKDIPTQIMEVGIDEKENFLSNIINGTHDSITKSILGYTALIFLMKSIIKTKVI